jgi:GNAT superfamily N-acetyltransferase
MEHPPWRLIRVSSEQLMLLGPLQRSPWPQCCGNTHRYAVRPFTYILLLHYLGKTDHAGRKASMTVVVRLAAEEDMQVCEAHMRRVLDEDLRGYQRRWHRDIDDLAGTYLYRAGWALFVAEHDGTFAGTTAVKPGGPASPPAWLAQRYAAQRTGQLTRVWIARQLRRRGIARALVTVAAQWALDAGGYTVVCLHTDASSPGALRFWRTYPGAVQMWDERPDVWDTVHFELNASQLPIPDAITASKAPICG